MNRITHLLAAVALAGFAANAVAEPIDDYIAGEMAQERIPGLAIAILRDGRLLRAEGYGFANLEHLAPVHADTLFKTGATGMQFTAAGVMLLVQDGKIRLDDSIRSYLPEVPRSWQPITIRQLLNHTSGLPATPNGDFRADYTDAQLLGIIAKQDLNFAAGTRWRFSYADYIVLGFLVKRVSGQYYADLLSQRLFAPLGMRTARAIDELAVIPNRAAGYEMRDGKPRNAEWVSPTANATADGSLYLSVLDYAAWAAGMADKKILSEQSWTEIAKPARLNTGCSYPYGFGWYQQAGGIWWHSGSWQGFQAYAVRYLDDRLTIVVFANGESADAEGIARHVAGMVDPDLVQPPAVAMEDREPAVTARVSRLLGDIARGRAAFADFTDFAKLDFTERTADQGKTLSALGQLKDLALFDRKDQCGDTLYRYRARFEGGLAEADVSIAPSGKIGNLEIATLRAWDAPH